MSAANTRKCKPPFDFDVRLGLRSLVTKPTPPQIRIAFAASDRPEAQAARERLTARYGAADPADAQVIVALGGDGFMLETLHTVMERRTPVFGMHRGSFCFLMNDFEDECLLERLAGHGPPLTHTRTMDA